MYNLDNIFVLSCHISHSRLYTCPLARGHNGQGTIPLTEVLNQKEDIILRSGQLLAYSDMLNVTRYGPGETGQVSLSTTVELDRTSTTLLPIMFPLTYFSATLK